jgi:hypothetical protein
MEANVIVVDRISNVAVSNGIVTPPVRRSCPGTVLIPATWQGAVVQ